MSEDQSLLFRRVFGQFATGVSVMTTDADGVRHGMTANAVTSVSLEPPLVLVCVQKDTVMSRSVADAGAFALSFLSEEQEHLSNFFADPERPIGNAQFVDVPTHTAETGAPLLDGCLAWVDCRVWETYDGGDHLIVVGEVLGLGNERPDGPPLLYFRSGYGMVR